MKRFLFMALLIFPLIFFSSCSGDQCAAKFSYLIDIDSDCVPDGSDNCNGWYNPEQFDGDEDGIGAACDSNDSSATEAGVYLIDNLDLNLNGHFQIIESNPENSTTVYTLQYASCPISQETITISTETTTTITTDTEETLECSLVYQPNQYLVYCLNQQENCVAIYEND